MNIIKVEKKVLANNDIIADENRNYFKKNNNFTINLVSSPGSGKTSLVEETISFLKEKIGIAVIEGDIQTDLDAQRIAKLGIPVTQIITDGACHLEANLIKNALETLHADSSDLIIIENVGNLVCPAEYDLGEEMKIVLISVTEGDDKPLKYPAMFRNAAACVINKIDLIPYIKCDLESLKNNALSVNPELKFFLTSCSTGEGINEWCTWLQEKKRNKNDIPS